MQEIVILEIGVALKAALSSWHVWSPFSKRLKINNREDYR